MRVPEVLLSGHAEKIRIWKRKESLRKTLHCRPEMLDALPKNAEDEALLEEIQNEENQPIDPE